MVVFGWEEDLAGVWIGAGEVRRLGGHMMEHYSTARTLIADLRDGPFEMDGPNGRWRWSLVD